ncbi:hypothetical protein [Celeribacter neptunius]|uniref:Uncharacterized protein n=1 Tax=Celeribacter neptunius TaxID=588602 RepID=A0A1I3K3M5_9RHOB|nr:hypothetical protein [Celeribacter neptunius]SFI67119.1 hypothetical protein SAMN04487991_0563 [Celeribacter neptunius]
MTSRITPNLRTAFLKAAVILIPSYVAAYLTDKMVYVVLTLAAAGIFASTIETRDVNRLLDEGEDTSDGDENGDADFDGPSGLDN